MSIQHILENTEDVKAKVMRAGSYAFPGAVIEPKYDRCPGTGWWISVDVGSPSKKRNFYAVQVPGPGVNGDGIGFLLEEIFEHQV